MTYHYPAPESNAPQEQLLGLSNEARNVLGSLASNSPSDALLGSEVSSPDKSFGEISTEFHDFAIYTRDRLDHLMRAVANSSIVNYSLPVVPELHSRAPEFAHIDWKRLEAGYKAYKELDLEPELVINPIKQPVILWHRLYAGIKLWQDQHPAPRNCRLAGEGLITSIGLKTILPGSPPQGELAWEVSILPGTDMPPVRDVLYSGVNSDNSEQPLLTELLNMDGAERYPSVESYLMFQLCRLHTNKTTVDRIDESLRSITWLAGSKDDTVKLFGRWSGGTGRVGILDALDYKRAGMRPRIKG
jgi:hypothetical protein